MNRHARGALGIGEMALRDFRRWGISRDKLFLLPYAVAGLAGGGAPDPVADHFARRFPFVFLFVGTLCRRKGADLLLEAFAGIARNYPRAGLVLAGPDSGDFR